MHLRVQVRFLNIMPAQRVAVFERQQALGLLQAPQFIMFSALTWKSYKTAIGLEVLERFQSGLFLFKSDAVSIREMEAQQNSTLGFCFPDMRSATESRLSNQQTQLYLCSLVRTVLKTDVV